MVGSIFSELPVTEIVQNPPGLIHLEFLRVRRNKFAR